MVEQLLDFYSADAPIWINQQNSPNLETPLHLVAKLGRVELIDSLFSIHSLNDTQRDREGRVCYDVAKNEKVAELLNG